MIASLPMYDRPELADSHHAFWHLIRHHLGFGPGALHPAPDPWAHWTHPDLLFSQTCGLPYRTRLAGTVHYVATPDFDLPGCPPGYYRSVLVARGGDERPLDALAGARVACNDPLSQSGYAALVTHLAGLGLPHPHLSMTGAHVASARAVAQDAADLAALDAQTWHLIQRYEPWAKHLRAVDWTAPTPGLPYVTGQAAHAEPLRKALQAACADLSDDLRHALNLRGIVHLDPQAYFDVAMPDPAPPRLDPA